MNGNNNNNNNNNNNAKNKSSNIDQLIEGHNYDGVQEFNNPAPFWWQLFFYISIAWSVGYAAYYLFMDSPSSKQELAESLEKLNSMKPSEAALATITDELLSVAVVDPEQLKVGAKIYVEKCVACHAPDGGGLIGPNLTDNYWIHGQGTLSAIYSVIKDGVGDKGMPPWEAMLSSSELVAITGYVKSIRGKPVATAKPPQGDLVE